MFTTLTQPVSPTHASAAARKVDEFRTSGGGSNRTNWERLTGLLAAAMQVVKTGVPVDVTVLFPVTGNASAYHLAHRCLSSEMLREYWASLQIVTLKGATWNGNEVTGESSTTRGTVVLLCPVV